MTEVSRYVAIMLTSYSAKSLRERRVIARLTVSSISYRQCIGAMARWLFNPKIPIGCKLKELVLAPSKIYLYLSGRTNEAAILDWRHI